MAGVILAANALAGDYEDARRLVAEQKWNEALPLLKRLNEESPESIVIAQDYAQTLLRLNRREEALEILRTHHLTRQAEIAGKSFLSKEGFRFYQQGLDWMAKRSYAQACERLEKALERDRAHAEILFRLGQCEILDGNADPGLKHLEQSERIYGKSAEIHLWKARALALRGRFEEALLLFQTLSTKTLGEPALEWSALWWGETLLSAGQKSQALALFENDAKKYPFHLQTHLAAIRLRLLSAESPNQFLSLAAELKAWQDRLERRLKEKPKKSPELLIDLFDAEALQRAALEMKTQIQAQLPSPTPSPTP